MPADIINSQQQRRRAIDIATYWGVAVNLSLTASKIFGGIIGQSQALVADGIHSLSDLITDGMVLLASKHAHTEADEQHPYGHGRFETIATVALGVVLIGVAFGIGLSAINRLSSGEAIPVPGVIALWVAAFSIVANEVLFRYTLHIARKVKSNMLEANAWHSRSDAMSSIVVFIGLGGAMIGWPVLDAIAAIAVAFMIGKMGWEVSRQSVDELVDTALDSETVKAIRERILKLDDVKHLHMLRTRKMGNQALVDVHIQVPPRLSVSEGHRISEAVEQTLIDEFDDINDVTVHIDAENDEIVTSQMTRDTPLRKELLAQLNQHWQGIPEMQQAQDITLHYLEGKVDVELCLPLSVLKSLDQSESLQNQIRQASQQMHNIRRVDVYFR